MIYIIYIYTTYTPHTIYILYELHLHHLHHQHHLHQLHQHHLHRLHQYHIDTSHTVINLQKLLQRSCDTGVAIQGCDTELVLQELFYFSCYTGVVIVLSTLPYPIPPYLVWMTIAIQCACEGTLPPPYPVWLDVTIQCAWESTLPPHPTLTKSWGRVECERAKRFPKEGIDDWSDARVETMSRSVFWSDAKCVCSEVMSGMVFWSDPVTFWGYRILRNPHMLKVPISIFPGWLYFSKWMN